MTRTFSSRLYGCGLALLVPLIFTQQIQATFAVFGTFESLDLSGGSVNTNTLVISQLPSTGLPSGMSITGTYSFNATHTSAEFDYYADAFVIPGASVNYSLDSNIQASFSTNDPNSTATISLYEESSTLYTVNYVYGNVPVVDNLVTSTATVSSSQTLPASLGTSTSSSPVLLSGGSSYGLIQYVVVDVDGLDPSYNNGQGELITMDFPNNSNLDPAVSTPEPSSLALFSLGACGLAIYVRRRRQPGQSK